MKKNILVAYIVLGVYLFGVCVAGMIGAVLNLRGSKQTQQPAKEHFLAGAGLATITWFLSMAASLFSGYSVTGIVAEAYTIGWQATRWISAGVGVYMGFLLLSPRLYALGKQRGYMTTSEFLFDRYLPPFGTPKVAHAIRICSFFALQLPIFTYLITQFQAVGNEVRTFTQGEISATTAVLVCAAIVLVCHLLGGMRSVAFTNVLQGAVLLVGSIIFLVIQHTELGGLSAAASYYRNPANLSKPNVAAMQLIPSSTNIVAYWDFVFKTSIAATMFPHLFQRLFVARSSDVMQRGMAAMNFTFFVVQLASMFTGWVAIAALPGPLPKGSAPFSAVLLLVAQNSVGRAVMAALLLAAALCAMMSTADSALLAFSAMWVRDLFRPYIRPNATQRQQLWVARGMAVIGLAIGVLLGLLTIEKGTPNLTGLFSLQNVTPIHVAPSVWLGLHWRRLRGEAVLAGMVCGLTTTIGMLFTTVNVKLAAGLDLTACGLSTAMIGFFVNVFVTVSLGLLLQYKPQLLTRCMDSARALAAAPSHLDIGLVRDPLANPWMWCVLVLVLLFGTPFYRTPNAPDVFVGDMASWAFVALILAGLLAVLVASAYMLRWRDYVPEPLPLPTSRDTAEDMPLPDDSKDVAAADIPAPPSKDVANGVPVAAIAP